MRAALLSLVLSFVPFVSGAAQAGPQAFSLNAVRLQDGPLLAAQQRDRDTLLALDFDRLLAPYRREAGLPATAPSYGNWESSGLDGHMAGHYLSALAMMAAATDDPVIRERLDQFMAGLKAAQLPSGYLGGIPKGEEAWTKLAAGEIKVDNFSLNGRWVPWYNLHKIAAGLRDAHVHAGHPDALPMLRAFADWTERVTGGLRDTQMQASLRSEHGGMNELFADLAALSNKEPRYLALARRFSHQNLLQPLLRGEDRLNGMHANTQIPKVIGFARLAELGAEPGWLKAAQSFWQTVVERRSVAIGGNSVKEHFHDATNFQPMLDEVEGPETCNSVNMIRLSELLFRMDPQGQGRYADTVERTLFNHILASQHPQHGGFVYFTPMRPQHYRVYSATQEAMWCCVGSGLESHARHGAFIYAHEGQTLYLNLFAASTLDWAQQGVRLRQQTRFPDEAGSQLVVEQGGRFALRVRQPAWTRGMSLRLNGKALKTAAARNSYVEIPTRDWRAGDRLAIQLPMRTTLAPLPGRPDQVAVLHGPIVLAAKTDPFPGERLKLIADGSRMGHIAHGQVCPQEQAPMFVAPAGVDITKQIRPVKGQALSFTAPGLIQGSQQPLQLIPFFRLHDARYMLYWGRSTPEAQQGLRIQLGEAEAERLALAKQTIDQVAPGEQQPESDHGFQGEGVETGMNGAARWRHARQWFAYTLNDRKREAKLLRIGLSRADAGRRFEVRVNGQLLQTLELGPGDAELYTLDLPIPAELLRSDGKLEVRFVALPGSIAGALYSLRLMR